MTRAFRKEDDPRRVDHALVSRFYVDLVADELEFCARALDPISVEAATWMRRRILTLKKLKP